ncbi:DMT family transporter [Litchfieldia salsa]|uniref:Paired small multidrug resistance pump n=1 Tax=Litchfieldia salsa TaxID=930152 RepID=A0A1H0WUC8_9BACI|nr:SMR family transporter [Litchfieldia salsa]SDP93786.1 paired small multidrug resistance pump [Litchfieldia salsa]
MNRNWILVIIAGFIEIVWAIGLKHASNWLSWVGIALLIYVSFVLLIKAQRSLPVATVYATFTGIGTAGTVVVEMVAFGVAFSWMKVFFILILLTGVIGLKLVTTEPDMKEGAA